MLKTIRILLVVLAVILLFIMIFQFSQYTNQTLTYSFFGFKYMEKLSLFSSIIYSIGFFTALIGCAGFFNYNGKKTKEYEKKLETKSIDNSKDKATIAALERKIATLEKALKISLDNNNRKE